MGRKQSNISPETVAGVPFEKFAGKTVRFEVAGEERFGRVCTAPEGKVRDCAAKGLLLVSDAIFPTTHRLRPNQLTVVKELPWDYSNPLNRHREKLLAAARETARNVNGFRPGKIFSVPVGDGLAWYVVTKVTARTATVKWRGFHCDNWRDPTLDWGGVFPRSVIERLVRRYEGLQQIFSAKR